MTQLLVIDRDGVLNELSSNTQSEDQSWRPIAGSLEAVAKLSHAGIRVVVAANQPEVKRRGIRVEALHQLHARLHLEVAKLGGAIEAFFTCPCLPKENCDCYKPRPGMLHEIAARLNVQLKTVPVVGDSLADLEAARSAGAIPILVLTGEGMRTAASPNLPSPVRIYRDLATVADLLLAGRITADTASRTGVQT